MSKPASRLPDWWFGQARVPLHARLLATVYAGLTGLRRWLYDRRLLPCKSAGVPVLVIGNITVGGTGKTPLTIATVQRLQAAGWKPGVASRGYGRRDAGSACWVEATTDPGVGGDEPVLVAAATEVPVRVDADRVAAARELAAAGCDIVVCDDGLQHYRLRRDLEIEVVDARRGYGNGRLLPAGPLREPQTRAERCDFRVVNLGADAGEAGFGKWSMRLRADSAQPLLGGRPRPLGLFAGQRVHAVAGIGHPQRFFDMLREQGIGVVPHAFDDHHRYTANDLAFGSELPVLMTEKDAVKCMAFASDWHYSVPVQAVLPEAFWVALLERLAGKARSGNAVRSKD
ncbi:tetraacyldisaccharide 4'-kinase [Pseudoxanthomonas kalamensis DSM 18571]|uniref:tetraacyldisaccharide 4'-kinase n=1 Tax=Pseudoxanthomonas kalamensis TaxID=289483 RepID=UPI00139166BB|nr:tetraacyldisaccharide 4'-kinase [Pseudoxanthomonas kalamensis]KAF1708311.1 tetraacyldisaccharide 4'-kinase [Pseudoxanthomonas kalamensis DSM 18571]